MYRARTQRCIEQTREMKNLPFSFFLLPNPATLNTFMKRRSAVLVVATYAAVAHASTRIAPHLLTVPCSCCTHPAQLWSVSRERSENIPLSETDFNFLPSLPNCRKLTLLPPPPSPSSMLTAPPTTPRTSAPNTALRDTQPLSTCSAVQCSPIRLHDASFRPLWRSLSSGSRMDSNGAV